MITYFYWALVLAMIVLAVYMVGVKMDEWQHAGIAALIIFAVGSSAYYFHFQQVFVKHYGGVMTIAVPAGQHHIAATWKDDNLWIENYDPKTNTCYFKEYSKGNLLQGKVTLKNCKPISSQNGGYLTP